MTIKRNMAQCNHCGDVIESKSVHDWKQCSCHAIYVDGGKEYVRRGFRLESDFKELTEYEEACESSNRPVC